MKPTRRLFVSTLALGLALAACASGPPPLESLPTAEFRIVATEADSPVEELTVEDHTLRVLPARYFHIERAQAAQDEYGFPALALEIAAEERAAFRAWTGENVRRNLAFVHEGEVLTVATIMEALPGRFQISGGVEGFSEEQVARLVAAYSH